MVTHLTRCVFSILSVPLCPSALILLHCSLTPALHAILHGLPGTQEGMGDRNSYLQRIFICIFRTEFPVQRCFLTSVFFGKFIYSGRSWVVGWSKKLKFAMHSSNQTPFSTLQKFQPSGKHICRKLVLHTGRKNPSNFYKKRNKNTCFTAARLKIHIYSFFIFMFEIFLIFYLFISF